jgi:site-specific recombinase XerD
VERIGELAKLESLVSDWLVHLEAEGKTPKSLCVYKSSIQDYLRYLVYYKIQYDQISMKQLDEWKISLVNVRKIKPRSVNYYVSGLKSFYHYLENNGFVFNSAVLRMRGMKFLKTLPRPLSEGDMTKLIEGSTTVQQRAMMEVFYGCGLRHEELRMLNVEDVDLEAGVIRVIAKGGKEELKPLAGMALEALRLHMASLPQGPLWICPKFKGRISQRCIRNHIKRLAVEVGVAGRVHPHRFRHSFATHMINHGAGLEQVKTLMGHASIQSTMIYTEVATEKLHADYRDIHPRAKPPEA